MSSERKAAMILGGIVLSEGAWLVANLYFATPRRFLRYCGFARPAGIAAWLSALAVAAVFVYYSVRLPSVRANLVRFSGLKALAIGVGIAAGFCEEVIFRKMLMDSCSHHGWGVVLQIAASAFAFGAAHAIWGLFRGNLRAAVGAMIATGALGLMMAITYVLGGRNVAPCIVSHMLINFFAEPGLVLSAVRGEMGRSFEHTN